MVRVARIEKWYREEEIWKMLNYGIVENYKKFEKYYSKR